jgi:phospholipid/cholesterol/gamma-HCH transport system ATP-binding protein
LIIKRPDAKHVIEFRNITKTFGNRVILDNINFTVDKQEILAVIGHSGVGKSTILKLVSGLIDQDDGEIILSSTKKGMAFQFAALLNFLTVKENIALPLRKKTQLSDIEIDKKVHDALENVGLLGTENLYPPELSGGMQKRVSFARAVVNEPDIILYDEPTSGLDPMTSTMIINDICHLKKKLPAAGIIVTHDMATIDKAADKVVLLYEGQLVFNGKPCEMKDSNNPFGIQFATGSCEGPMKVCIKH